MSDAGSYHFVSFAQPPEDGIDTVQQLLATTKRRVAYVSTKSPGPLKEKEKQRNDRQHWHFGTQSTAHSTGRTGWWQDEKLGKKKGTQKPTGITKGRVRRDNWSLETSVALALVLFLFLVLVLFLFLVLVTSGGLKYCGSGH